MKHLCDALRLSMRKIWTEKLKQVMEERGLKAKTLSTAAGLNETYIRDVLQKGVEPTIARMTQIADALGLPLTFFFAEDVAVWPTVPIVGSVTSGEEWRPIDDTAKSTLVNFAEFSSSAMDAIAITVTGTSMSPVYRDGDILICKRFRGVDIGSALGRDCAVKTVKGEFYLKLLLRGTNRNTYRLRSYNPIYPDIENVAIEWAAPVFCIKRNG